MSKTAAVPKNPGLWPSQDYHKLPNRHEEEEQGALFFFPRAYVTFNLCEVERAECRNIIYLKKLATIYTCNFTLAEIVLPYSII